MAEVWVTLGGAAIAAGGSVAAASMNKQSGAPAVQYQPVDLQQTQNQAISGDQSSASSLDALLGQSNSFQQQQATGLMNQALPGYSGFAQNLTNTASAQAANPYAIPQSVVGQLSQYAAENNINEGTGAASGFSSSNLLRSLGVNALQYGQSNLASAQNSLSVLSNTAPKISPMSPMSFMVTPQQQAANQTLTNSNGQAINQGAANSATAAGNANSASLWDSISSGTGQLSGPIMQALMGSNQSGVGGQTSYASFLANNPNSSAAIGQTASALAGG
jgi:hypothetical protein